MRNKRLLRVIAFIYAVFLVASPVLAQDRTITGTISDQTNAPLPGATVAVKGDSRKSVSTDANGKFSITVASNVRTLTVSYVGMSPQDVSITGKTSVSLTLTNADNSLNEVVVIGYGTSKRADVTSAISSISEKDIKNLPVAGVDQALQGKVAGVTVNSNGGQPGGGVSVRVRGITTVTGTNEPLYVIDGVPVGGEVGTLSQQYLGGGSGSTIQSVLATLNPADIASIDILKDASAQAIYGSRGANGVVLINTKRGKAGEGKISYDSYYGWQEIPKKLPIMNLREYAAYSNSLVTEINAATGGNQDTIGEFQKPELLGVGTDWQDEIYQRGYIHSQQLSFSGGQGKTNYYFSGGYFDQLGTLIETKFKRYSFRFNIDQQVKTWLKAGMSANLSRSNQKIGLSDGFDAVTSTVLYNSPAAPVRDFTGNYEAITIIGGTQFGNQSNPVALAEKRDVQAVRTRVFGGLYADAEVYKNLTIRNEINYDFNLGSTAAYQPLVKTSAGANIISPSKLREERNNSIYWAWKTYANYNETFGKHGFNATLGHEVQASKYDYIQASRVNLVLDLPSLAAGAAPDANGANGEELGAGAGEWSMESFFGRIGYTYDNRYSISGSLRTDGSSSFGPGKRWGTFHAVSAGWTVTNEAFAQNMKAIDYLKLRLGYGEVGGQDIGQNAFTSNITLYTAAPFGPGGLPANVPNLNIGWQTVNTYNVGVDISVLKRRLDVSLDVYKKVTTDMLLATQLPEFSGLGTGFGNIQTPIANDGQTTNKGVDLTITSYNVQRKDFTWKTTVIFSMYKNKLDFLNTPDAAIAGTFDEYGDRPLVTLTRQGYAVGSFYGFVTDGLFTSMDQLNNGISWGLDIRPDALWLGDVRFKDLNGDKIIDNKDVTVIGDPNPDFTYGITNNFSYKGFDLSIFLQGSQGADIYNYARRLTEGLRNQSNNQVKDVLKRYTATNTNTDIPRYNQWHQNNFRISDRFIEDGSYLRIQTLSLGWNVPKRWANKAKMTNARVYVSAQNLYTFTKYSGYDPELGAFNNNFALMNIDNGHYPNPRTLTVGVNIEF